MYKLFWILPTKTVTVGVFEYEEYIKVKQQLEGEKTITIIVQP